MAVPQDSGASPNQRPVYVAANDAGVTLGGITLLDPVTLSVDQGETLAVVGPNGSGKTTLLRVLTGLMIPTTGAVTIAGMTPDDRSPVFRRTVAAILGQPPFARNLTLREHMILVGASWGLTETQAAAQADGLLEDFEITALRSRFPHELSSGQVQLYSLALSLCRPFDVLLLDEPEQRLDPAWLQLVLRKLQAIAAGPATIILATHSPLLVEQLADHTVALQEAADA
jgi:ABC-type multidrug transport system ATPase subunit